MKPITIGIINDFFNFRMINNYMNTHIKDPNCKNCRYEIINYKIGEDTKTLICNGYEIIQSDNCNKNTVSKKI